MPGCSNVVKSVHCLQQQGYRFYRQFTMQKQARIAPGLRYLSMSFCYFIITILAAVVLDAVCTFTKYKPDAV
jgi:hypothetical protein